MRALPEDVQHQLRPAQPYARRPPQRPPPRVQALQEIVQQKGPPARPCGKGAQERPCSGWVDGLLSVGRRPAQQIAPGNSVQGVWSAYVTIAVNGAFLLCVLLAFVRLPPGPMSICTPCNAPAPNAALRPTASCCRSPFPRGGWSASAGTHSLALAARVRGTAPCRARHWQAAWSAPLTAGGDGALPCGPDSPGQATPRDRCVQRRRSWLRDARSEAQLTEMQTPASAPSPLRRKPSMAARARRRDHSAHFTLHGHHFVQARNFAAGEADVPCAAALRAVRLRRAQQRVLHSERFLGTLLPRLCARAAEPGRGRGNSCTRTTRHGSWCQAQPRRAPPPGAREA